MRYPEIEKFCRDLVTTGGTLAANFWHRQSTVSVKSDHSLVTQADGQIESILTEKIRSRYPDHQILGEEAGGKLDYQKPGWIIDPIEGTTNFIHQVPLFGTQIAFIDQGIIKSAAMFEPISQTLISASKGSGATFNNQKIGLTPQKNSQITLLFDTGRDKALSNRFLKSNLLHQFRSYRRLGCLTSDVIFLSSHKASCFLGFNAHLYDFAPSALILSESGYHIVDNSLKTWSPSPIVSLFAFYPQNKSILSSLRKIITPTINE